jgi:hypothetical protein
LISFINFFIRKQDVLMTLQYENLKYSLLWGFDMPLDEDLEAIRKKEILEQKGEKESGLFKLRTRKDVLDFSHRLNTAEINAINEKFTAFIPGLISCVECTRSKGSKNWDFSDNAVYIANYPSGFKIKTGMISGVGHENEKGSDMNNPEKHLEYLFGICQDWYGIDLSGEIKKLVEAMQPDYDAVKEQHYADKKAGEEFRKNKPKEMLKLLDENELAQDHKWLLEKLEEYARIYTHRQYGKEWPYRVKDSKLHKGIRVTENFMLHGSYSGREIKKEANSMEIATLWLVSNKPLPVKMDVDALKRRGFGMLREVEWGIPVDNRNSLPYHFNPGTHLYIQIYQAIDSNPLGRVIMYAAEGYGHLAAQAQDVLEEKLLIRIPVMEPA